MLLLKNYSIVLENKNMGNNKITRPKEEKGSKRMKHKK